MSAKSVPQILVSNGYVIHSFGWNEPLNSSSQDSPDYPMISVAKKISERLVKQLLNIGLENGKVRFYSGNGFVATDSSTFYSTYLQDSNEEKFLSDLNLFISKMSYDPYGAGYLVVDISKF